jgi:hypothetical protein
MSQLSPDFLQNKQQDSFPKEQDTLKNQIQMIKTLIHEKYTQEYKLDRKTRQKAEEILKEYYQRNPQTIDVSMATFLICAV